MAKGKKYYNKETERARQLNERNKKKHTGENKQRLCKKIYGEEEANVIFKKDMFDLYNSNCDNSVIMENKRKYLTNFSQIGQFYLNEEYNLKNLYIDGKDIKDKFGNIIVKDCEIVNQSYQKISSNLCNFEEFQFKSIEEANSFCDDLKDIKDSFLELGYELPFFEYFIFKISDNGEIGAIFNRHFLKKLRKIQAELEVKIRKYCYDILNGEKD